MVSHASPRSAHHRNGAALLRLYSSRAALLLGGSSVLALLAASGMALAADPVRILNEGSNGKDSSILFGFRNSATAGGDAREIRQQIGVSIQTQSGVAIELGTKGGRGGNGDFSPLSFNEYGEHGGKAGSVVLDLSSRSISGGKTSSTSNALIQLYAIGGTGGNGFQKLTAGRGLGAGGQAGEVTLKWAGASAGNSAEISAKGDGTPAIHLLSQGGHSGGSPNNSRGGTYEDQQKAEAGGDGGTITAQLGQKGGGAQTITTTGRYAPAVVASSQGGMGGSAPWNGTTTYATNGGDGGRVKVENEATIITRGSNSTGIVLQSVGGNGGYGGGGAFTSAAPGSPGGNGGDVEGTNNGRISTEGAYSFGIMAQSVGGSGGRGRDSAFAGGGAGGAAGKSGSTRVTNTGIIETRGTGASAIVAQSVGGGNALDAFRSSAPTAVRHGAGGDGGHGGILPWSSGGQGGAGGFGGKVDVTQRGTLTTEGDAAYGIFAQSVGGGGGNGGDSNGASFFLSLALGGKGGGGGNSSAVTVNNLAGSITTYGSESTAIVAQSIGGGGGSGGQAIARSMGPAISVSSAVGGAGGDGGKSETVTVNNKARITTTGVAALGIQALSIGGGGGNGGGATAQAIALPLPLPGGSPPSVAVSQAVGGSGGKGGDGGKVIITNDGTILTSGDDSVGIYAQSTGGGGGYAGSASSYTMAVAPPGSPAFDLNMSVGGSGGDGGKGNTVEVVNALGGSILTSGKNAFGISALSVGGGGGAGGGADVTSDVLGMYSNYAVSIGIGGSGGKGGIGEKVTVTNKGTIATSGEFALAISALSIGGGGGYAGSGSTSSKVGISASEVASKAAGLISQADSAMLNVAVGGSGGDGGDGGLVNVTNQHSILTQGNNATAIFAQSVGGGGGRAGGFQGGGEGKLVGGVSVGGSGGKGGRGDTVTVTNSARAGIVTEGTGSHGILAQSVGGGGGAGGGFVTSTSKSDVISDKAKFVTKVAKEIHKYNGLFTEYLPIGVFDKKSSTQARMKDAKVLIDIISLANSKDTSLSEKIMKGTFFVGLRVLQVAFEKQIKDIQKQIQPGEAVKLPDASLKVAVGGSGGSGGKGGDVIIANDGKIATSGDLSFGVLAQSIGGGGGIGGGAFTEGQNKLNLNLSVGGAGADGQTGGKVKVTNAGTLHTTGTSSYGIFAQSVGGGGGIGGGATSDDTVSISANANVGGKGGKGGTGGAVDVINRGTIITTGLEAHGIVAQSVGGGGGIVFIDQVDPLADAGNILPPRPGSAEAIATDEAFEATLKLLKELGIPMAEETAFNYEGTLLPKRTYDLSYGGTGTKGADGGDVLVRHATGQVSTHGDGAFGIFAQSIGGGGGFGSNMTPAKKGSAGLMDIGGSFGGSGGAAGNGGKITVELASGSSISTAGHSASAIFLQSIGGGGGYSGFINAKNDKNTPAFISNNGSSGDGGNIVVTSTTASQVTIATTGTRAHGIHAQSLGGGGGAIASMNGGVIPIGSSDQARSMAQGTGGKINIWLDQASIHATGEHAYGLFLQSGRQKGDGTLDNSKGGDITVRMSGTLLGGSDAGAAIRTDGGNTKITLEKDAQVSALSGIAVLSSHGVDELHNSGRLTGNIDLASTRTQESNSFTNMIGGLYASLAGEGLIHLGSGGKLVNSGDINIGGLNQIGLLKLTGGAAELSGRMLVDIDAARTLGSQRNDRFQADGPVTIRGLEFIPNFIGVLPGTYTLVSGHDITTKTAATMAYNHSGPITWDVDHTNDAVSVRPTADFAGAAAAGQIELTTTEAAMASSLQTTWNAGTTNQQTATTFAAMASVESSEEYHNALASLSPEGQQQGAVTQSTIGVRASLRGALSCPVFADGTTMIDETQCVWAKVSGSYLKQSESSDSLGYSQNSLSYRMGGQWEFRPDWFIGASAAYTAGWGHSTDGFTSTDSKSGDIALSLKHQAGPWYFAAAAHLGYGVVDLKRSFLIGNSAWSAKGNSDVWTVALRGRAAYEFAFPNWYIRPYLDVDAIHTYVPGYAMSGQGGTLSAGEMRDWTLAISPNVELGMRVNLEDGSWLRPYASIGATYLVDNQLDQNFVFGDAFGNGFRFVSTSRAPEVLLDLGVGLQFFSTQNFEIRGEYNAQVSNDLVNHEGSARFSVRF